MRTKIALIGLLLAVMGMGGLMVAGPVAAQEQLDNETTVPGVDAGENRTVTTDVTWADAADAANDSATIEIEHVVDGNVTTTTTETVNATPGETTTNSTTLSPSSDVDEFQVNVTSATPDVIDDVSVTSDASSGGGGGFLGGDGSSSGVVGGVVVILVVLVLGWAWRDR